MRNKSKLLLFLALFTSVVSKVPTLEAFQQDSEETKYWVFFNDKGTQSVSRSSDLEASVKAKLSSRALKRRRKVRSPDNLVDRHDFPVSQDYLRALESRDFRPLVVSNWLNAATVLLTVDEAERVQDLPFVKMVRPVSSAVRRPAPDTQISPRPDILQKSSDYQLNYGASLFQNELLNIPAVHELGITGHGIVIGMLDTGFKIRNHDAFLELDVLAQFDFLNNDNITENEIDQDHPQQHDHGTQTLSVIGGFKEGELVGVAFSARFLLAKTEDLINEVRQEEDNWVAGLEWLERNGADIVTSSLGYLDFYEPSDMDGNTAVTTIAADLAVQRGLVVVNSAGNEGNRAWQTVISPADADSVIAVGAVDAQGNLASFSSLGPTSDGRIKPDVVAMGVGVLAASPSTDATPSPFGLVSGTSFSGPAVAGVAALILSAHPYLTPLEIREALRLTADRADAPDNQFGWGIVDAYESVLFHGPAFSNQPQVFVNNSGNIEIRTKVISKAGIGPEAVQLVYRNPNNNQEHSTKMAAGPEDHQFTTTVSASQVVQFYFSATDSSGQVALHPHNAPDSLFTFSHTPVSVTPQSEPTVRAFVLHQNHPNPFNPATQIDYFLQEKSEVTLVIYNVLGQKVRILLQQETNPSGDHSVIWDSRDDDGKSVPTGIYIYRLQVNKQARVKKMLLLR